MSVNHNVNHTNVFFPHDSPPTINVYPTIHTIHTIHTLHK
jgi:hypothetical protein